MKYELSESLTKIRGGGGGGEGEGADRPTAHTTDPPNDHNFYAMSCLCFQSFTIPLHFIKLHVCIFVHVRI